MKKTFTPRFWTQADRRLAAVREIRARIELLKAHAGADSYQKQMMCERAVFLALQLETAEREALETGQLHMGRYVQGINGLTGCLRLLGLNKHADAADKLQLHLAKRKRA